MSNRNKTEATPPNSWFSRSVWLHSWPALIALAAAFFRLASPDVPLGLAWGRAIVDRCALPATNVFSHMNPEHVVLLDKWLFQATIYLVHMAAGTSGLVCLRVVFIAIALFAAAKAAGIQWNRLPHALLGVIFTVALLNRCYVRAEIVTWAAIPLTLCIMPLITRGEKKGWILLIALQALWANSHGYWIVGPMLWAAAGVGAVLLQPSLNRLGLSNQPIKDKRATQRLMLGLPVALAAACLTPYGIKTIVHPIRLAVELYTNDILSVAVDDFGSPLEAISRGGTIPLWACLAVGIAGIAATVSSARHRKLDGQKLAILILGLLLGLRMYRNLTILAICALPLVAEWLQQAGGADSTRTGNRTAWKPSLQERQRRFLYALAVIPALLWTGSIFTGWGPVTDYGARIPGFGWHYGRYPIAPANWIAVNMPDAKLWNDFGEGGWLNWRLGEGRTYIDGNTDGYPLAFLRRYHESWRGTEVQPWITESNKCTAALVDHGSTDAELARFLTGISWYESPGFAYANDRYVLVLADSADPNADAGLSESLRRNTARRIKSGPHKDDFALEKLMSTPPDAPNSMYERSGRLAVWLFPGDPRAKEHFEETQKKEPRIDTN